MQLEQQIYSIEAANINHETLQAMKQAGEAMKQIHGGMSLEQVDETMYVMSSGEMMESKLKMPLDIGKNVFANNWLTGTSSENNINSARKLATLLQTYRLASRWTRETWRPSWRDLSRRPWTSACSTLDLRQWEPGWRVYPLLGIQSVSSACCSLSLDGFREAQY